MRCEDEKMFYRPPLLEEPCAQTLSGKNRLMPIYFQLILRLNPRKKRIGKDFNSFEPMFN